MSLKSLNFVLPYLIIQMRSQCHTCIHSYSSSGQLKNTVTTGLSKMRHMLLVCAHD